MSKHLCKIKYNSLKESKEDTEKKSKLMKNSVTTWSQALSKIKFNSNSKTWNVSVRLQGFQLTKCLEKSSAFKESEIVLKKTLKKRREGIRNYVSAWRDLRWRKLLQAKKFRVCVIRWKRWRIKWLSFKRIRSILAEILEKQLKRLATLSMRRCESMSRIVYNQHLSRIW